MNKLDRLVLEIICAHGETMASGITIGNIRYKVYKQGYSLSHQQIAASCNRLYKAGLINKRFIKYVQIREINCPMQVYEGHDEFCQGSRTRVAYYPAHKNILANL